MCIYYTEYFAFFQVFLGKLCNISKEFSTSKRATAFTCRSITLVFFLLVFTSFVLLTSDVIMIKSCKRTSLYSLDISATVCLEKGLSGCVSWDSLIHDVVFEPLTFSVQLFIDLQVYNTSKQKVHFFKTMGLTSTWNYVFVMSQVNIF